MKKIFTLILTGLYTIVGISQQINYRVEIVGLSITGCDDGWGDNEEPTWKLWSRDNATMSWVGGNCLSHDGNAVHIYEPSGGNELLANVSNSLATQIEIKFEAWEDDNTSNSPGSADRCSFGSGDDCHILNEPLAGNGGLYSAINIADIDQCTWEHYFYNSGAFGCELRVKWEYADFDGGPSQSICGNGAVNLDAEGSGFWSIYSGSGGGISNATDPNAGFSGVEGTTYQVLWNSYPECLTARMPDTVLVNVYDLPNPNLTSNVQTFCEGDEVTFDAANGNSYDFYVNNPNFFVESNVIGQFDYILQANDSVVYVTSSNGNCTGRDSIHFEVMPSPTPVVQLNFGVLSTTISYPFNQWYYNGSPISGATTSSHTPAQNGTYLVEVANADGCISKATYVLNNIGVSEMQHNFVVYPNPASDMLYVDGVTSSIYYELRDQLGRLVQTNYLNGPISLSVYSSGLYFLSLFDEEGNASIHKIEIVK